MPKLKKIDESRTSALHFCKFILPYIPIVILFRMNDDDTVSKTDFTVFVCVVVGRQKFVRDVLNAAPLVCESEEEAQRERLHFFRPAANSHIPEKQTPSTTNQQGKPSWHNIKKRQRQSERCDSSRQSPPTKRLPSSALTAEDLDLLNNY